IDQRLTDFKPGSFGPGEGKAVFTQNCGTCHQIDGTGGLVGPQLDGIGNWGGKALTQKILDPNRNISEAFRTYNITLNDGKSLTGLHPRTEGEAMVFADPGGREFTVAKKDMKEYKPSPYTLMPDQFRHTIPEKEFYARLPVKREVNYFGRNGPTWYGVHKKCDGTPYSLARSTGL
uniref:c-type cytochrome n=1 Tax=Persicitalea sp. TaxID=3100273 RepID=UPI0035936D01